MSSNDAGFSELVETVRRIELRIVGDPDFQSIGLVQELVEFKRDYQQDRKQVAEVLDRVTDELAAMRRDREDQVRLNEQFKKQPKEFEKQIWKYGTIAFGTISALGAAVTWLQNTNFIGRMFHG